MKAKKLVSCILAGVMAVAMAVPAFASKQVKIAAAYQDVVLDLIVPATGKAYINPYGLPIDIPGETDENGNVETLGTIKSQQITTMPMYIANLSTVDLFVGADVTLTAKGSLKLNKADAIDTATDKQVSVKLEAIPSTLAVSDYQAADADTGAAASMKADKVAAAYAPATGTDPWASIPTDGKGGTLDITGSLTAAGTTATAKVAPTVTVSGSTKAGLAALKKATESGDDKGKPQAGSVVLYRLNGKVVKSPVKGTAPNTTADPWVKADGFDAVIAFSFEPGTYPS